MLLNAGEIEEMLQLHKSSINKVFVVLGLITQKPDGNRPTVKGIGHGGVEEIGYHDDGTEYHFVLWHRNVLTHRDVHEAISRLPKRPGPPRQPRIRDPEYRTEDGHRVRSEGEVLIDNWLFLHDIKHVVEPFFPGIGLPDFGLPDHHAVIEYWGWANRPGQVGRRYNARRIFKQEQYRHTPLHLINVMPDDMKDLSRYLKESFEELDLPPISFDFSLRQSKPPLPNHSKAEKKQ